MTTKLPKSKATNAFDLLSEVADLIIEEPRRYNQEVYRIDDTSLSQLYNDAPRGLPDCGTVGCVAGWVATLKHPGLDPTRVSIPGIAAKTLGLTSAQRYELFSGGALIGVTEAKPQTATYAKAGAKHIAAFQKRFSKQLKAQAV